MDYDVIVIGAGIAGFSAAVSARDAGAKVLVLRGAPGATAFAGGAWDVVPFAAMRPSDLLTSRGTLADELLRFAEKHPLHPYGRMGKDLVSHVNQAHARVLPLLKIYSPLNLYARGMLVITEMGFVRRVASAQMQILNLDEIKTGNVAIAHFSVIRDGEGRFLASVLSEWGVRAGDRRRYVPMDVDCFGRKLDALLHPHELAEFIESSDGEARVREALLRALKGREVSAVLLPPLLGMAGEEVRKVVEKVVLVPTGEFVSTLAGAQSQRLERAMMGALKEQECEVRDEVVRKVDLRREGSRIELEQGESLKAGAIVCATGKYVGGGIGMDQGRVVEKLSGLPLFSHGRPMTLHSSDAGPDPVQLFGTDWMRGGAGYSVGVGYTPSFNALDRSGDIAARDFFVAGALLDGVEPSRDGTGLGCCATTGYFAGRAAAMHARG